MLRQTLEVRMNDVKQGEQLRPYDDNGGLEGKMLMTIFYGHVSNHFLYERICSRRSRSGSTWSELFDSSNDPPKHNHQSRDISSSAALDARTIITVESVRRLHLLDSSQQIHFPLWYNHGARRGNNAWVDVGGL